MVLQVAAGVEEAVLVEVAVDAVVVAVVRTVWFPGAEGLAGPKGDYIRQEIISTGGTVVVSSTGW